MPRARWTPLERASSFGRPAGLVLIGVHSKKGGETMAAFVKEQGTPYPVAHDVDGTTAAAYYVNGYPDDHIIDRAGNLRVADCANGGIEAVVRALLAEPAPAAALPGPLGETAKSARAKDERVLALVGEADVRAVLRTAWDGDADVRTLLRNEYELVELGPDEAAEWLTEGLLGSAAPGAGRARLIAFSPDGERLGAAEFAAGDEGVAEFLEAHRLPAKDAEALLADGLARAKRENKRFLVHIGAPW